MAENNKIITIETLRHYHDKSVEEVIQLISDAEEVTVSGDSPTNEAVKLWVNTDDEKTMNIPEINDSAKSLNDTWSSQKISTQIQEDIVTTIEENAVTYADVDELFN